MKNIRDPAVYFLTGPDTYLGSSVNLKGRFVSRKSAEKSIRKAAENNKTISSDGLTNHMAASHTNATYNLQYIKLSVGTPRERVGEFDCGDIPTYKIQGWHFWLAWPLVSEYQSRWVRLIDARRSKTKR